MFVRLKYTGRRLVAAGAAWLLLAGTVTCGGSPSIAPSSPEAAVESFLAAVRANSLTAMGELWGTTRGPNASRMPREELEKRLSVIRIYLQHESFEIVPGELAPAAAARPNARAVHARLSRHGCQPVVPFTVVPYRDGWLVADIDLSAAGNPARPCVGGAGSRTR